MVGCLIDSVWLGVSLCHIHFHLSPPFSPNLSHQNSTVNLPPLVVSPSLISSSSSSVSTVFSPVAETLLRRALIPATATVSSQGSTVSTSPLLLSFSSSAASTFPLIPVEPSIFAELIASAFNSLACPFLLLRLRPFLRF